MKKIKLSLLALMLSAAVISCKKDKPEVLTTNNNTVNTALADEQNASESNKTETSVLALGISIEGASKITGTPPIPNGTINFQLNTAEKTAFQEVGFQIKFNTSSNIAGAYILFKDADGNSTGEYFDVPVSAFEQSSVSTPAFETRGVKNNPFLSKSSNNKTSVFGLRDGEEDNVIDVDFENIPAGTFCYEIYLYDDQDNVSNAEELCITVEAWGGNAEIVGEWVYDVPENNGGENTIYCENGSTKIAPYYINYSIYQLVLELKENGDYSFKTLYIGKELDHSESSAVCSAVYADSHTEEITLGKFSIMDNEFILISFAYDWNNYLEPGQNSMYDEIYEDGSIDFGPSGFIINGNEMILSSDNGEELIFTKQ